MGAAYPADAGTRHPFILFAWRGNRSGSEVGGVCSPSPNAHNVKEDDMSDETPETPPADAPTIVVVDTGDAPPEPDPTPDAPAVVVVDTGDDTPAAPSPEVWMNIAERLTRIEDALALTATATQDAQQTAEQAAATADAAIDISLSTAEEVATVAEGEQAPVEEDEEPQREHPWYRGLGRSK